MRLLGDHVRSKEKVAPLARNAPEGRTSGVAVAQPGRRQHRPRVETMPAPLHQGKGGLPGYVTTEAKKLANRRAPAPAAASRPRSIQRRASGGRATTARAAATRRTLGGS